MTASRSSYRAKTAERVKIEFALINCLTADRRWGIIDTCASIVNTSLWDFPLANAVVHQVPAPSTWVAQGVDPQSPKVACQISANIRVSSDQGVTFAPRCNISRLPTNSDPNPQKSSCPSLSVREFLRSIGGVVVGGIGRAALGPWEGERATPASKEATGDRAPSCVPRRSSGRRPISPESPCRRGSRTRFGGRPTGS
jgi:hypothetical protein